MCQNLVLFTARHKFFFREIDGISRIFLSPLDFTKILALFISTLILHFIEHCACRRSHLFRVPEQKNAL